MLRYFSVGFLVLALSSAIALCIYRTESSVEQPVATADLGGVSLRIDYATTSTAREKGLGGRTSIPTNYGMLFVFPEDDYFGFWMKDMLVPIDIFWLDNKGQVVSISYNVATTSYPNVFYPPAPVRYVLETAAGFAREHAIEIGTPLLLKNFPIVSE